MSQTLARQMLARHLRHPPARERDEPWVLLSIKPHYAGLIERGEKRVEFRRRFPKHFEGGRAVFYVSSPVREIALVARIVRVERTAPAWLWKTFGADGATSRAAFDEYFVGAVAGVALVLEEVRPLRRPIRLDDPRLRANHFRPPQSLAVIPGDSPLARLVGIFR